VITRVGRRVLEIGVGLFALLGFAFVPLGKKTALEHTKAIIATGPAKEAGNELLEAGHKLRARLLESVPPSAATDAGVDAARPESLVCVEPLAQMVSDTDAGAPPSIPHCRHPGRGTSGCSL
jgi:hypothetical protein